jgi:hypothetical protein
MTVFLAMEPYTNMRESIKRSRLLDRLNEKLKVSKGKLPQYGVSFEEFYSWVVGFKRKLPESRLASLAESKLIRTGQLTQVMRQGAVANVISTSIADQTPYSFIPKPDPAGRSVINPYESLKANEYQTRQQRIASRENFDLTPEENAVFNDFYFLHYLQYFLWSLNKVVYRIPKVLWQDGDPSLLLMPTDPLRNCPQWSTFIGLEVEHDMNSPKTDERTYVGLGIWYSNIRYGEKDLLMINMIARPQHLGNSPIAMYWIVDLGKPTVGEGLAATDDLDFESEGNIFGLRMKSGYRAKDGKNANEEAFLDCINAILFVNTEYREQVEKKVSLGKRPPRVDMQRPYMLNPRPAIQDYHVYEEQSAALEKQMSSPTFLSRKAHIRKGHWHGYWTGPRASDKRIYITKWVMPTFVRGTVATEAETTTTEVLK